MNLGEYRSTAETRRIERKAAVSGSPRRDCASRQTVGPLIGNSPYGLTRSFYRDSEGPARFRSGSPFYGQATVVSASEVILLFKSMAVADKRKSQGKRGTRRLPQLNDPFWLTVTVPWANWPKCFAA